MAYDLDTQILAALRQLVTGTPAAASAITTNQITVAATATVIKAANASRQQITIYNNGNQSVYLGPADTVTTSNGHILPAGASITLENMTGAIYGIVASSTAVVSFLEA